MFRKDQNFYLKASSFPKKVYNTQPIDFSKCRCFQIQQIQCNGTIQKSVQIFMYKCFIFLNKDMVQISMKNLYLNENSSKILNFEQENFSLKVTFNDTREKLSFLYQIEKWIVKKELKKEHKMIKIVGKGGFASVILTSRIRKNQKKQFAVKEIKKKIILNSKNFRYLENEIQALRTITHKNSLRLYEVYESSTSIYLVTEYIKGGTLQDRILKKRYISPNNAVQIGVQILDLIKEINKFKLIHRDIKPSNIMFKSESSFEGLKLIDYGLCANFTDHSADSLLHDKSGTACYLAPELVGMSYLKKFYDEKADVFSIGIILYEVLAGFNPFVHSDYNESLILNFNYESEYNKIHLRFDLKKSFEKIFYKRSLEFYQQIRESKNKIEQEQHKQFKKIQFIISQNIKKQIQFHTLIRLLLVQKIERKYCRSKNFQTKLKQEIISILTNTHFQRCFNLQKKVFFKCINCQQ